MLSVMHRDMPVDRLCDRTDMRGSTATPALCWLGMFPQDVEDFAIPASVLQPLTPNDDQCIVALKVHPLVQVGRLRPLHCTKGFALHLQRATSLCV